MQTQQQTFEGQTEQLPRIRDFVENATASLGLDEDDAFACRLVVDEAATNAFEHAYRGKPGRVQVEVSRRDDLVILSVRDWGAAFDPASVPTPDLTIPLDQRTPGGLGIYLMHKFMDEVSFRFSAVEGNAVTMQRRLGHGNDRRS